MSDNTVPFEPVTVVPVESRSGLVHAAIGDDVRCGRPVETACTRRPIRAAAAYRPGTFDVHATAVRVRGGLTCSRCASWWAGETVA